MTRERHFSHSVSSQHAVVDHDSQKNIYPVKERNYSRNNSMSSTASSSCRSVESSGTKESRRSHTGSRASPNPRMKRQSAAKMMRNKNMMITAPLTQSERSDHRSEHSSSQQSAVERRKLRRESLTRKMDMALSIHSQDDDDVLVEESGPCGGYVSDGVSSFGSFSERDDDDDDDGSGDEFCTDVDQVEAVTTMNRTYNEELSKRGELICSWQDFDDETSSNGTDWTGGSSCNNSGGGSASQISITSFDSIDDYGFPLDDLEEDAIIEVSDDDDDDDGNNDSEEDTKKEVPLSPFQIIAFWSKKEDVVKEETEEKKEKKVSRKSSNEKPEKKSSVTSTSKPEKTDRQQRRSRQEHSSSNRGKDVVQHRSRQEHSSSSRGKDVVQHRSRQEHSSSSPGKERSQSRSRNESSSSKDRHHRRHHSSSRSRTSSSTSAKPTTTESKIPINNPIIINKVTKTSIEHAHLIKDIETAIQSVNAKNLDTAARAPITVTKQVQQQVAQPDLSSIWRWPRRTTGKAPSVEQTLAPFESIEL